MIKHAEMPLPDVAPMDAEERAQMRVVLARARQLRDRLLRARGGRLFPDSGAEVAQMRADHEAGTE